MKALKAARFSIFLAFTCLLFAMISIAQNTKEPEIIPDTISHEFIVPITMLPSKTLEAAAAQTSSVATIKPEPQPYIYETISLDEELQRLVWQACEETGCPYELALAVIWNESKYQNIVGDGGNSIGYMQIQPRWHQDRMKRLGVTDLTDSLSNFRVGCDLLAELLDKYSLKEALTCYNTGSPGQSSYADRVVKYMEDTFRQ